MTPLLWTLTDVSLPGPRRARVERVSLVIRAGRTAILGESGAGKTSLLNLLVGFETPQQGSVTFHSPATPRLPIFWSPADGGLWPHLSQRDHLRFVAPRPNGGDELLDRFDLRTAASESVDELSAGERSRLTIARALAADAEVLVLDEPLVHVDPARLDRYWGVVREWCDERSTSLVFSCHQPEIVLAHAEQVVVMHDGRVSFAGPVEELYERPPSEQLGWSLGPINWLAPAAARDWLGESVTHPVALRPEKITAEVVDGKPSPAAPVGLVESSARAGNSEVVTLRHPGGERRTFHVRAEAGRIPVGAKVLLRALVACLVAVCLPGCSSDSSAEPEIKVSKIDSWALPNEGPKIPAPRGLHIAPNGDLMVLDDAGRLMVYDPNNQLKHTWWMPEYSVGRPEGLWVMLDGRIAIADTHYHRIVLMRQDGTVDSMFGEEGTGPGQFIFPETCIQDPAGRLYVCEYGGNDRVQRFSPDGTFELAFGGFGTAEGEFQRPTGLVWHDHTIYVCDAVNNRVQAFSEDGEFLRVVADAQTLALYYPYDMAISPQGELFVVEFGTGRVTKLSREGKLLGRFGSSGTAAGQFWTPWGVAVTQDGRVFVGDTGNRRLVELRL